MKIQYDLIDLSSDAILLSTQNPVVGPFEITTALSHLKILHQGMVA